MAARRYIVSLATHDELHNGHDGRLTVRVVVEAETETLGSLIATQIAAATFVDQGYMPTAVRAA